MAKPLALDESSGSVRLVSLLERACSVVKAWRDLQCSPSPRHLVQDASDRKRIIHLSELTPGEEFTVVEPLVHEEHKFSRQPLNTRRSHSCFTTSLSTSPLPAQAQYAYARSKTHPNHHRRSQSELKPPLFNFARSSTLISTMTSIEERQPFNAILNFIPVGLPEKVLLKQTILVTTLCSSYLSEAHSNDVTREPTSSSASATVTSNHSGGRAPNYRQPASSTRTEITMDNRRHRFSALSFPLVRFTRVCELEHYAMVANQHERVVYLSSSVIHLLRHAAVTSNLTMPPTVRGSLQKLWAWIQDPSICISVKPYV